jgi:AcrR family transcriptional regulator
MPRQRPAEPTRSHHSAQPTRGRPRSEQAHRAVLTATLELLRDEGWAALTIDAIAKRAGVARTTIYRWWPSSSVIAVDVLVELGATAAPPPPGGGDPRRAIRLEMRRIAAVAVELPGRILSAVLGEAQHDPAVRVALLERLIYPRREATMRVIRDAQARGLLRADVAPNVIADLFYGPIFYRMLMGHEPSTERFATQTFERVLAGLTPEQ